MILIKILSGKQAGAVFRARRFPVRIGRDNSSDLQLDDEGVWDQHLIIRVKQEAGWVAATVGDALATVNAEPVAESLLKNGDVIQLGGSQLQFWLSEVRQSSLFSGEAVTWAAIVCMGVTEFALLYWLLRG